MWKKAIILLALLCSTAQAGGLRAWAKKEARLVRRHGAGHYQPMPRGVRFVGTGTGNQTCMAGGKCSLKVRVKGATVRLWK